MAQFIGFIQGSRGEATRLGTRNSGMRAEARGWYLGGEVTMSHVRATDNDIVRFCINGGSNHHSVPYLTITAYFDHKGNLRVEASDALRKIILEQD